MSGRFHCTVPTNLKGCVHGNEECAWEFDVRVFVYFRTKEGHGQEQQIIILGEKETN